MSEFDCHSLENGGLHTKIMVLMYTPRFAYQFSANLPNGLPVSMVEAVDVKVDWDPSNNGYADIIILEDCGTNSLGAPNGDVLTLEQYANPSGCTGVALPDYTPTNTNTPSSVRNNYSTVAEVQITNIVQILTAHFLVDTLTNSK